MGSTHRSQKRVPPCHNSGFTLVELIMVLTVVSILVTVGIPSFMNIVSSSKVATASNYLVSTLHLARSEAVRSGTNTVLCKSSDGSYCGDNAVSWSNGWLLYTDENNDNIRQDNERIIRAQAALDSSFNFIFRTATYIKFTPSGRSNRNGRFCFENAYNQNNSRAVIITQAGRFRTEKRKANNNCAGNG
ncbi:GspH/FimT family pseudopilin [Pseudomonadota bacterium]